MNSEKDIEGELLGQLQELHRQLAEVTHSCVCDCGGRGGKGMDRRSKQGPPSLSSLFPYQNATPQPPDYSKQLRQQSNREERERQLYDTSSKLIVCALHKPVRCVTLSLVCAISSEREEPTRRGTNEGV